MKEMSSRERVFAALERREPDRVPIYEVVIDTKVIDKICPGGTYFDLVEKVGLDIVGINQSYDYRVGVEVIDEEKKIIRDKWGVIRGFGEEMISYPIEGPIKSEEDIKSYVPPDPEADGVIGNLPEVVRRFKGEKAIYWVGRDAFINASYLRGMENLLMDFELNPEFAHEVIELCLEHDMRVNERGIEAGADIVVLGDDYAHKHAPLMSPAHFREFILPGLSKVVKAIKDKGAYCIKHTDGNIWPILDMIVGTGIDGINPLEPVAGMDIGEVKAKYGDRVCVVGNIDCGEILSRAPVERVIEAVKECISKASPGGGHIMSSSNSIHSSVKPENYLTMIETTRKSGRYPIAV